jgi:signal peptidase I
MTDAATPSTTSLSRTEPEAQKTESWGSFLWFVAKLVIAVLIFRTVIFSPFTIPSESMLPGLRNGDYLVAAKWPYGISRYSLPGEPDLFEGRIFATLPDHGDVVIFKHPVTGDDYVKRVIGLPGDTVSGSAGQVILNGTPLDKEPMGTVAIPMSANTDCDLRGGEVTASACLYSAFRETTRQGRSYLTLDYGPTPQDDFGPVVVPAGKLFVMGDNRDNSMDSRFPAVPGGGVGLVDTDLLVGRASRVLWSTDGSASWLLPWTWFTAARWNRIGSDI